MLNNKPKVKIRLTGIGKWLLFLAFFLLFSAQNTGNNLLYLVSSCLFTTLFFAFIEGIVNRFSLQAKLNYPEVVLAGEEAEIICHVLPNKAFNQYHLRFEDSYIEQIKKNYDGYLKTSILLEKSGRYSFKDFSIIKLGMLGVFYVQHIFPEFVIYSVENFGNNAFGMRFGNKSQAESLLRHNGRDGEFWSQELYHEGEDASKINWIVSARSLNEWVIVRNQTEENQEQAQKADDSANSAGTEMPFEQYDILGKTFKDFRSEALLKPLNPSIYRLIALIGLLLCTGVYSTGFLLNILPSIFILIIILGIKGKAFDFKYHKPIYYSCIVVALYIVLKSLLPKPPLNIVLLLEFSLLILILQFMTMLNIRNTLANLTLMLMIILGIAAMNVNFAFPAIFLPFLIMSAMVLSFLRYNTISSEKNTKNQLYISPKGLSGTILLIVVFILLWIPFFYLIPRTTSYGLASELSRTRSTRGYSNSTLNLNDSGYLEDNQTVVMRLIPSDEKTVSTSILRRLRKKLIRGGAFSEYEDGEWKKTRRGLFVRDLRKTTGEVILDKSFSDFKNTHDFEIILENSETPTVFIPDQTKLLNFRTNFIGSEMDGSMFFADNRRQTNRKYMVTMLIDQPEIIDSDIEELSNLIYDNRLLPYMSLNGSTDKIMQICNNFMQKSTSISERTEMVMKFLKNGYSYSLLQPEVPKGTDPVEYFLFDNKAGTCQHFATAMVFLLRGMGIPSRVANGYIMGEWNEIGNFFTVRQSHAHAWVEVYYPQMGWVSYDPTPPDQDLDQDSTILEQFWEKITAIYEGFWFSYIYSFDVNAQSFGIKKIFPGLREAWRAFYKSPWIWGIMIIALIICLVFSRILYAAMRYWSRKNKWTPFSYLLWETNLIKFNVFRGASETPFEFHNRLKTAGIINDETRQKLYKVEDLINEYGFNPKADKYELITQISELLQQIQFTSLQNSKN